MHLKQQNLTNLKIPKSNKFYKTTPMMSQYLEVKERHKEYLLFYRMGDFYELFFEDAKIASKELGITLTKRGKYNGQDIPMCGVPHHSSRSYLSRLIKSGYKVAVAEQLGDIDKKLEENKKTPKIFSRDVVRIITPGTVLEENLLESQSHNFLASLYVKNSEGCVSWVDMTTGDFRLKILDKRRIKEEIKEFFFKLNPIEIITTETILTNIVIAEELKHWSNKITIVPEIYFDKKNNVNKLKQFFNVLNIRSLGELSFNEISCSGALIDYIQITQKNNVPKFSNLIKVTNKDFMEVDKISTQSLEIFSRINGEKKGSLIDFLDKTITAGGSRLLHDHLGNPLLNKEIINKRLHFIEMFIQNQDLINSIRLSMKGLPDVLRALSRISAKIKNPRDVSTVLIFIIKTLQVFSHLKENNQKDLLSLVPNQKIISNLKSIARQIEERIIDNPPVTLNEGGFIAKNFSQDLDKLRNIKKYQEEKILNLQSEYSISSNISNLKIKFNNFHGYFIEVSNKNAHKINVLDNNKFLLIQNTLHSSRFQTQELKSISIQIEKAEIESLELEKEIYDDLCQIILDSYSSLTIISNKISYIDVILSHASIAIEHNFVKPVFNEGDKIKIEGGRHPVVESSIIKEDKFFKSNDCVLEKNNNVWLMTGPNMAGKSTFLRQTAIIIVMSQIGSYVPAKNVELFIIDKLFTRVGASDDLSQGLSTFMTEMVETARIINGASERSLIILDEVGRGTSTSDGLALAWSILEYLVKYKKCPTLFATHYKELTEISKYENVMLKTLKTKEHNNEIIFLYEVVNGISESSFGIHVAKLAGINEKIIFRAQEILDQNIKKEKKSIKKPSKFYTKEKIKETNNYELIKILKEINLDEITPKQALELLYNMKNKV